MHRILRSIKGLATVLLIILIFVNRETSGETISSCTNPNNFNDLVNELILLKKALPDLHGPWNPLVNHDFLEVQAPIPGQKRLYSDLLKVLKLLSPYYLPKISNVGGDCQIHLSAMGNNDWTMEMVDSWGKFPDGILSGNTRLPGLYEQCVDIVVTETTIDFKGKYCTLDYEAKSDTSGPVGIAERISSARFWYATCMPSSCTDDDLKNSVNEVLAAQNLQLSNVNCMLREKVVEYTAGTIVMITIICIIGTLMISSLCVEYYMHHCGKNELEDSNFKYLFVWSPYRNMGKIFHLSTKETPETINCLHGLRTLSMTWVVYGHAYIYDFTLNRLTLDKTFNGFFFQVISNFLPCVDSFFFMSGLLVAYNLTRDIEKTKKFNIFTYYIHRFLRLSPPMFLIVGLLSTIPPLIIFGPLAPTMFYDHALVDRCRRFWYRDPLFITNCFHYNGDTESCLPQCWYMANDMDLYIIAPIMILPLIFYGVKKGGPWLALWTIMSVVIPAIITGVYQLPPTQGINISWEDWMFYTSWLYTKPWARASPYIVGLWMGYYMWKYRNAKVVLNKWIVVLGWLIAVVCGVGVVFGMHKYMLMYEPPPPYNAAESIIYGGSQRLAWGVALAWVTFACKYGYGGPVNSFLSHPSWQPLSRLTYCMYLISTPIQEMMFIFAAIVPSYYNSLVKLTHAVGSLFIIGLAGLGISLASELPVLGLERLTLRKSKSATDNLKNVRKDMVENNPKDDANLNNEGAADMQKGNTSTKEVSPIRTNNNDTVEVNDNWRANFVVSAEQEVKWKSKMEPDV